MDGGSDDDDLGRLERPRPAVPSPRAHREDGRVARPALRRRPILGLGAGGNDAEFAGYGAPLRTPSEKVEALAEALEIIRGTW